MEANTENRTIALAALFQAVDGVVQIATHGRIDSQLYETSVMSLLKDDYDGIADIYGGLENLTTGFRVMMFQLGSDSMTPDGKSKNLHATRYAVNLLHLEKKIAQNEAGFRQILDGIADAQKQLEFFEATHTNITARLAELYSQTISNVQPKIMVKGESEHLGVTENAAKIRTLLLAGFRAALLWRQAGGSRWKLLFERGKMQRQAEAFLKAA